MKKYDILYNWPISEITHLSRSDIAENYCSQLSDSEQDTFLALTEKINALGEELKQAKADKVHFLKWNELQLNIIEFNNSFQSFPQSLGEKLLLTSLLASKLLESLPVLDEDIDIELFELRSLTKTIPQSWFIKENSLSLTESIVIFSCKNINAISTDINSSTISPNFLFHFIAALHNAEYYPSGHAILVKKTTQPVADNAINAFVNLLVLADGEPIHTPKKYTSKPSILNHSDIQFGAGYHQWNEILNVLSEYNYRDEILLKFLTIYHVIENLMFKLPIVILEQQKNGKIFSIRDFRRLYDQTNLNENKALHQLFNLIFQIKPNSSSTDTFKDIVTQRWTSFSSSTPNADINSAFEMLGLDFEAHNLMNDKFHKLIYMVRNCIVHNKETEFHLTYEPLDSNPTLCKLIEDFLLPSLEEICFSLISKNNSELWYKNKEMCLYV
ncbi:TPA: hypothetical protein SMP57_002413 [Proteus mirabilis]|nr:hypothetical protein [Proteus mirabilis]HEK2692507.1 hypothetical protein [Proteus mirabilis]